MTVFEIGVAGLFLLAAGTSGCATDNIRSDYDPTADFGQYETYDFFPNAGPEATNYQSFFSRYMVAAISRDPAATCRDNRRVAIST